MINGPVLYSSSIHSIQTRLVSRRLGGKSTVSESSFRTRAREIAGHLYSTKLAYSTRFFRLYPWDVTPRGATMKCQDLPRAIGSSPVHCAGSRRDVVFDRRTVLRYPVTPGKSSRWPACRGRRPGRGPPRTFSRGDGVSENRPAVEDDIHAACLYSAESRSGLIVLTVPAPPRRPGPVSALRTVTYQVAQGCQNPPKKAFVLMQRPLFREQKSVRKTLLPAAPLSPSRYEASQRDSASLAIRR